MTEKQHTDDIRQFWNENPVGSNFVAYESDKSFYSKYDEFRYRTEGHILGELDAIGLNGKKTLEIGLGQGADSMQLIDRGAIYYGIDLTEESVRRVKERFRLFDKKYADVRVGNATQIPYDNETFDIARVLWMMGGVAFVIYTGWAVFHSGAFDAQNYGAGFGMAMGGGGAGVWAKSKTEPEKAGE